MTLVLQPSIGLKFLGELSVLAGRVAAETLIDQFEISAAELKQLRRAAVDHAHLIELFFTRYADRQGKLDADEF